MTSRPAVPTDAGTAGTARGTDLDFYFDPACPWTWLTYRWLRAATAPQDIAVTWRSLSLYVLADGDPSDEHAAALAEAVRIHRVFAALHADGRNDLVGALYDAIGTRHHEHGESLSAALLREAAEQVGAARWAAAADDQGWDAAVEVSTKEALDLAGPDVGSPVLGHGTPRVGIFGPIVDPGPRGDDAVRLLDLVLALSQVDGFHELKRGRDGAPRLPSPPPV